MKRLRFGEEAPLGREPLAPLPLGAPLAWGDAGDHFGEEGE